MLSVVYNDLNAACRYAECHYAVCRSASILRDKRNEILNKRRFLFSISPPMFKQPFYNPPRNPEAAKVSTFLSIPNVQLRQRL
jgi:hypothetical protein